jgi:hypothetical protein
MYPADGVPKKKKVAPPQERGMSVEGLEASSRQTQLQLSLFDEWCLAGDTTWGAVPAALFFSVISCPA